MSVNTTRTRLYAACMVALAATLAPPAWAQATGSDGEEPGAKQLDTVTVTGSRIRRVDTETANPVFTLDRQAIEGSGYMTVGDLLQHLPNVAGAGMTPADNSYGGTGASSLSLRGLGAARTLVLLNGIRYYAGDINALPANMIQRVEVLKDGASAVYGSDAIAGVVNIITRTDFNGVDFAAYYGASDKGDTDTRSYQITVGKTFDQGAFVAGLNYGSQKAMLQSDRDWSRVPLALTFGQAVFAGSSAIPNGRYTVARDAAVAANPALNCSNPGNTSASVVYLTRIDGTAGMSGADFRCYVASGPGNDTYDFAWETQQNTPQDRYSVFANASYDLSDRVAFFTDAFYTHTESDSTLASDALFSGNYGLVASGNSIYNPFGTDVSSINLRVLALGQRVRSYDRDDFQLTTGFRGMLGKFDWDASYTYAKQQQRISKTGSLYLPALQNAIGPSYRDDAGTAHCGTPGAPIAGCTPLNIFGPLTSSQLSTLSPTLLNFFDGEQQDAQFNITGDLFDLPAGPVGAAFGYEYRRQKSNFRPDFLLARGLVDATPERPSGGSYDVNEVYAEFSVPLLTDVAGVQALNLSAGVRYSDYSTFGGTTNGKLGLEWRPYDDLLVRATVADIFRAPTINDLYGGRTGDTPTVVDPCTGAAAGVGQCSAVPPGFVGEKQPPATNGSNPDLQPETGRATSIGLVYNPSFYTPISLSLDVWRYKIEDAIVAPGAQTILDLCYRSGLPSYCALVSRNALGTITNIDNTLANVGAIDTRGVDFGAYWTLGDTRFGKFQVNLDATYLDSYDYTAVADLPGTRVGYASKWKGSASGGLGNFARIRSLTSLNWALGDFSATLAHRFISHVYVDNLDTASGGYCDGSRDVVPTASGNVVCKYKIPHYHYLDMSGSYAYKPWNAVFTVGVNNVFDKEMDPLALDYSTYDVIGRFLYARVQFHFD